MKASTVAAAALALGVASFGIAHAYPNPNFRPPQTPTTTTGSGASNGAQGVVSAVPEPATWALMLVGVAGLGLSLRARRTRSV